MRDVPECLNRRYEALDELIQELSSAPLRSRGSELESAAQNSESNNDPGIKLMCEFWNILKDDPDCNLSQHVKQRMGLYTPNVYHPQRVTCYISGKAKCNNKDECADKKRDTLNKIRMIRVSPDHPSQLHCLIETGSTASASQAKSPGGSTTDALPLSKVLCNLKDAASFDKKCNNKISQLMGTQKDLMDQIMKLEDREKKGSQLLQQADCMWSRMEDAYKKRVEESLERQKNLLKQLKDVEASHTKWRKNKKDLEGQMTNINKCQQDITEKLSQKKNDLKCIDMEITDFKKRIDSNKYDTDIAKKTLNNKKQASDIKVSSISADVAKLQMSINDQNRCKINKEQNGSKFVKESREDLQKICRVLLQKKLENEDLRAERDAVLDEINLLNQTMDQCKDRCKNKQNSLAVDIKALDAEISTFKAKCIRCHQCTDTADVRKYCTDCPRCFEERDCIYEEGHCSPDSTLDCVCVSVKQKFLDNVFDNMYTVLARQIKTDPGKAVAEEILGCLKRSRNGKINDRTKKVLQDFILDTVKQNLNLTIIGGAVKTRCEMDSDTYKQLMLCLKQVKVVKPAKEDKGTVAKKESCGRWGGTSECNCPSGPKACICTKKAPPPPKDPTPCPEHVDKEDNPPERAMCPHKASAACGPSCAMHAVPSRVGADVAQWVPDPCSGSSCPFSKSMRAAQCMLGPESLGSLPKNYKITVPFVPNIPILDDLITCRCGKTPIKPCTCRDRRSHPRERIIEEVMGRYIEVSPIEKVTPTQEPENTFKTMDEGCDCSTANNKKLTKLTSTVGSPVKQSLNCSPELQLLKGTNAFIEMLDKSNSKYVWTEVDCKDLSHTKNLIRLFPNPEYKPKRSVDSRYAIVFDPKFKPPDVKMNESTSPITSYTSTDLSYSEEAFVDKSAGIKEIDSNVSDFEKNINDTITGLIKDVIVSESNSRDNYGPDIEWMTVVSLIKKLSSLQTSSSENSSNVTNEEAEVLNEALQISSYIKTLLNDMILEELIGTPINQDTSSLVFQESLKEIAKREQNINNIMNDIDLRQTFYSNSSFHVKSNKMHTHGRCLKYFIQTMVSRNVSPNTRMYRSEDVKSRYNYNNDDKKATARRKNYRKPINLHKYLSDSLETTRSPKDIAKVFMAKCPKSKKQRTKKA